MSAFIMAVETATLFIELEGRTATAWPRTGGDVCYHGPIDGLPPDALDELVERGILRRR